MEREFETGGTEGLPNSDATSNEFVDESFDEFITEDSGFLLEDNSFIEDDNSFVEDEDSFYEDDEDVKKIEELRQSLKDAGYVIFDSMQYSELEKLQKRLYKTPELEQERLENIVREQVTKIKETSENVQLSQATYMQMDIEPPALDNVVYSMSSTLGDERCLDISRWINQSIRSNPEITADEIYETYRSARSDSLIALHASSVLRYVQTLTPMLKETRRRNIANYKASSKAREEMSKFLNRTEIKNTSELIHAKHFSLIRQIFDCGNDVYETICPECKKRIRLTGPAFRMIEYVSESRIRKDFFIGSNICECGNALMFTLNEYTEMIRAFRAESDKGSDLHLNNAKKLCAGAAEIIISEPISSVKHIVPHLFIVESSETSNVKEDNEQVRILQLVSDAQFKKAADQFYYKLKGLVPPTFSKVLKDSGSIDHTVEKVRFDGSVEKTPESSWDYHSAALYVTQSLSRDYAVDYINAVFSIINFLKSARIYGKELNYKKILDVENTIAFLKRFKNVMKVPQDEMAEVISLVYEVTGDVVDSIDEALGHLDHIENHLRELKDRYNKNIQHLFLIREHLAYLPILPVRACPLDDLTSFFTEKRCALILNEVADRMIIMRYAEEFFAFWKTLSVVNKSHVEKIFSKVADLGSVKKSVETMCERYNLDGSYVMAHLNKIFTRDDRIDAQLVALHKAFVQEDLTKFIQALADFEKLSTKDIILSGDRFALKFQNFCIENRSLLEQLQNKKNPYLVEFTEDEIESCQELSTLVFNDKIPLRLKGETPEQYCQRYKEIVSRNKWTEVSVIDKSALFEPFRELFEDAAFCALIPDSEVHSKAAFMFAVLTANCDMVVNHKELYETIGISEMHYNIIKGIKKELVLFDNFERTYRILSGTYVSALRPEISKTFERYDNITGNVNDKVSDIISLSDFSDMIGSWINTQYSCVASDEDFDPEKIDEEICSYANMTFSELLDWLGVSDK